MKKILVLLILITLFPLNIVKAADDSFKGFEWYDLIETVEVNTEPPHAYFLPYEDNKTALENEKSIFTKDKFKSKYLMSLNGTWNFYHVDNPLKMLSWDNKEEWDTTLWDSIEVPSNVQLQFDENGFKYDKPIYTNQNYPWINYEEIKLSAYPVAPTVVNGVSHYKRSFILDDIFNDREIFINFEGVGSAFYLYVNGKKVGYSEDSYTTHSFNITKYLNKDKNNNIAGINNTVAVQVYRFSDGSYLENQDMIRLNGIFRDVYISSKNSVEIRDIFVKSDIDEKTVTLEAAVRNLSELKQKKYKIKAYLYDDDDNLVNDDFIIDYTLNNPISDVKDEGIVKNISVKVDNIKLWNYESPKLYRLLINLIDEKDNVIEVDCIRFGFKKITTETLKNGKKQITLNNQPLLIKGVNRHEFSAYNGTSLTNEEILNDLIIIKQNNINAIRTSHYPNDVFTYEVADELGIMIVDEANIESHYGAFVDDIPSYYESFKNGVMYRVKNMVERDKNFASIIMYSLGNEATYKEYPLDEKYNFFTASKWILNRDESKLRVYERDNRYGKDRQDSMVDVFSSQYYSLKEIQDYLKSNNTLPYIQSEYAHSMGNGLGNLKEYWELFRSYDNAQGGFIWDFKDQSVILPINFSNSKEKYFAYGGDFGETVSDAEFCGNGLLHADGGMSAKMVEVKHVYQSINFKKISDWTYEINNENIFTDSDNFDIVYEVISDNKLIQKGIVVVNVPANSKKIISIDFNKDIKNSDTFINFYVKLKNGTNYKLKKGDVIAYEQFVISSKKQNEYECQSEFDDIKVDGDLINLYGKNGDNQFAIVFDKSKMMIKSYKFDNQELFSNGPYLNYTRAQISNDTQFEFIPNIQSIYAKELEDTMDKLIIKNVSVKNKNNKYEIKADGYIIDGGKIKLNYTIYGDGNIKVYNSYKPSKKLSGIIPKVGLEMKLSSEFNKVEYFGKGPYENYVDRNSGSLKAVYKDNINNMFTYKYLKPQESGNRTDVSWYKIYSDKVGLMISGDNLQITSIPYGYKNIRNAKHSYELINENLTYLNINGAVRGLGNAICKDLPLDKYVIAKNKEIKYSFMISPYVVKE